MMRLATLACAVISTVLGAAYAYAGDARPAGVIADLQRAQPERVFAARFSLESEYHDCTPDPRFADSTVQRETCGELREQPSDLDEQLAAAAESLNPDTLHVAALSSVIWWNRSVASLDSAVDQLALARTLTGDQVPLLVDQSAVYLIRAELTQSLWDILWGLDHAMAALEVEPGNVRARYNAALAAQALRLKDRALELWDAYLAIDSTSRYAEEAKLRRKLLLTADTLPWPTASSSLEAVNAYAEYNPQRARELGWEVALRAWGKAMLERKAADVDAHLTLAERLGTAIKFHGGDASLADAVYAIQAARGDRIVIATLARAHHAYAAGWELFDFGKHAQAADSFAVVLRLRPASRPLLDWARVSQGAALAVARKPEEARRVLQPLVSSTDTIRYPALSARVQWAWGSLAPDSATKYFPRAARTYAGLREWESYGGIRYRDAWRVHRGGDAPSGYRISSEALQALRPYRGSRHLHGALAQQAEMASADGMVRAAKLIQDENSRAAAHSRSAVVRVEALLGRARSLALADSNTQALRVLKDAAPLISELPDTAQVLYLEGALLYSRAQVNSAGIGSRIAALDSAMTRLGASNSAWVLAILMSQAELRLDSGDLRGAEADLNTLAAQLWKVSQGGPNAHLRAAVMERLRGRYDRLVMGYLRAGQPLHALLALERGRLSFATDTSRRHAAGRWVAPAPGQVVLEYALIGDTLLTWVVRRDSITVREQRLDRGHLLRTIAHVGAALESSARADAANADLRRLYEVLIRPVRDRIPGGSEGETELVIVADGEIAGMPFDALLDGSRELVRDHPIRYVSTLADAPPLTAPAPVDGRILLVANPAFDLAANAELDRLRGAAAEVATLRSLYRHHVVLADGDATIAAFRDRARGARVIHYAGHAVFDASRPEQSYLLLAGEGTSGRLRADSVGSMPLDSVRLVVLSACRTLRGRQGRSGGFDGLSGALLSAGADGVVGSLWLVNDSLAQPLMRELHRAYRGGQHPARALRTAQLKMIDAGHSPAAWAGYRYAGR